MFINKIMNLFKIQNLDYEIDGRQLFNDFSKNIDATKIYEVRGPNGSGKSTLLKIISGLIASKSVDFSEEAQDEVLYLGHKNGFVEEISLRENFKILGLSTTDELFRKFGLLKLKNQKYFNLSFGEKRKAALIRVINSNRKIWILDEPFAGLDAKSISILKEIFTGHLSNGGCIVIANHQEPIEQSEKIILEDQ
tara:strand:- start:2518 stop:3099 length:582 start_codon:yes stop_codon:yes gene_type:complete